MAMRTRGYRSGIRPWAAVFLAAAACLPLRPADGTVVDDPELPLVAVFPIDVFDTSGEPPNPQWPGRIAVVTQALAAQLADSGRYRTVEVTTAAEPAWRCADCWRDPARAAEAEMAAIAVVQKMSTLISSLHVWLVDVGSGQLLRRGAVSLRGDTEEAWRRAVDFLLRRGILDPDPDHPMLSSPFPGGG